MSRPYYLPSRSEAEAEAARVYAARLAAAERTLRTAGMRRTYVAVARAVVAAIDEAARDAARAASAARCGDSPRA